MVLFSWETQGRFMVDWHLEWALKDKWDWIKNGGREASGISTNRNKSKLVK